MSPPALLVAQSDVDRLYAPVAQASADQMQRLLAAIENDPEMKRLAARLDTASGTGQPEGSPPNLKALAELHAEIVGALGQAKTRRLSPIAAYQLVLMRTGGTTPSFSQQLFDLRRHCSQWHADADRAALSAPITSQSAAALVAQHHALADRQLAEAAALVAQARTRLRERVAKMALLSNAAERDNTPLTERMPAYSLFKTTIEALLSLQRDTLSNVGFWIGVRPSLPTSGQHTPYEHRLALDLDPGGTGKAPMGDWLYPLNRYPTLGLAPGFH